MTRTALWLLQDVPLERSAPGSNLASALAAAGVPYAVMGYDPLRNLAQPQCGGPPLTPAQIIGATHGEVLLVPWGGHQFCRAVAAEFGAANVLLLGSSNRNHWTNYSAELADVPWLNSDAVCMPWAQLQRSQDLLQRVYPGAGVFLRPDSGFKTFAGQVVPYHQWELECHMLHASSSLVPTTLVVAAGLKEIQGEFRFVVADGEVVAGSEYRWDNQTDLRRDWPPECHALARQVAAHQWQLDRAYVVDVALTPQGPRAIELNSFSHAGLYACDVGRIVAALTAIVESEL